MAEKHASEDLIGESVHIGDEETQSSAKKRKSSGVWNHFSVDKTNEVREMRVEIKQKFNKYWEEYSEILSTGAVFDPRIKLRMLEYCYSKLDATSSREKVENLKRKMHLLYEEYIKGGVASSSGASTSQVISSNILAGDRREQETRIDLGMFDLSDYDDYIQSGEGCDRNHLWINILKRNNVIKKRKWMSLSFENIGNLSLDRSFVE